MVSQKYRGSCIGAALAKWLAKNTVASQKMALEEKMEDGALEMLLGCVWIMEIESWNGNVITLSQEGMEWKLIQREIKFYF